MFPRCQLSMLRRLATLFLAGGVWRRRAGVRISCSDFPSRRRPADSVAAIAGLASSHAMPALKRRGELRTEILAFVARADLRNRVAEAEQHRAADAFAEPGKETD